MRRNTRYGSFHTYMMSPDRALCLAVVTLMVATGCRKAEIRTERIPKVVTEATVAPKMSWTLPSGWVEKQASGMRVGSFTVPGSGGEEADVSVIPLESGGLLENINRWRDMVGLAPISNDQIASKTEKVPVGDATGILVDVSGADKQSQKPTGILGAIWEAGSTTWFFKMSGPDKLVATEKPKFLAFLKSIHTASLPTSAVAASTPAPLRPPPSSTPPSSGSTASSPSWKVPAGWSAQTAGSMVHSRFSVGAVGGPEVTVSVLGGAGGGVLANVNRWRGQLGLPEVAEKDLASATSTIEVNGAKATLFEAAGTGKRMVAVILPHADSAWFFKLTGPDGASASEKATFLTFVQSVRF